MLEQEARAREAEALALAQNDALVELERSHVEIKVKDKVLEQQQREIQALKVCTSTRTAGGGHTPCEETPSSRRDDEGSFRFVV